MDPSIAGKLSQHLEKLSDLSPTESSKVPDNVELPEDSKAIKPCMVPDYARDAIAQGFHGNHDVAVNMAGIPEPNPTSCPAGGFPVASAATDDPGADYRLPYYSGEAAGFVTVPNELPSVALSGHPPTYSHLQGLHYQGSSRPHHQVPNEDAVPRLPGGERQNRIDGNIKIILHPA